MSEQPVEVSRGPVKKSNRRKTRPFHGLSGTFDTFDAGVNNLSGNTMLVDHFLAILKGDGGEDMGEYVERQTERGRQRGKKMSGRRGSRKGNKSERRLVYL